jgi:electron transport complex protein RnfG
MRLEYLKQAWLVLILALTFGGALAGVYLGLNERIERNKRNETYNEIPKLIRVVSGGVQRRANDVEQLKGKIAGMTVYKAYWAPRQGQGTTTRPQRRHIGWVLKTAGLGYADRIELLVGLDAPAETILGISVLEQKETPGLGDKIRSGWNRQFAGKRATQDLVVVKGKPSGNEIAAISGATVSSSSVSRIVNKAVIEFRNAWIEGRLTSGKD